MATIDICPRCNETRGVRSNRHSASDARRYRCQRCLKTFQLHFRDVTSKPGTHQATRCGFDSCYCLIIVEPVSSVPSIGRAGFRNLTLSKDLSETLTVFPLAYSLLKNDSIFMRIRAKSIEVPI